MYGHLAHHSEWFLQIKWFLCYVLIHSPRHTARWSGLLWIKLCCYSKLFARKRCLDIVKLHAIRRRQNKLNTRIGIELFLWFHSYNANANALIIHNVMHIKIDKRWSLVSENNNFNIVVVIQISSNHYKISIYSTSWLFWLSLLFLWSLINSQIMNNTYYCGFILCAKFEHYHGSDLPVTILLRSYFSS